MSNLKPTTVEANDFSKSLSKQDPSRSNTDILKNGVQPHLNVSDPLQRSGIAGSPNKLNQPSMDHEPERPLIQKHDRSSFQHDLTNMTSDGESSLLQHAMKLKDQNVKLRTQLRDLKITLKDTLGKVQAKNKQEEQDRANIKDNSLARELEQSHKQIGMYRKEIQAVKNRLDSLHNQDKIVKLENIMKDKNRQIDILNNEKRNLEKIKSTQDKEIEVFQKEFGYEKKLGLFQDEARQLREKIRVMTTTNRSNDKTFKKQQEYLVALSNQYRIICDKLGIAPSLNFTRAEELNSIINNKIKDQKEKQAEMAGFRRSTDNDILANKKASRSKSVRDKRDPPKLEPTPENMNKVQSNIEALQQKIATIEKDSLKQISELSADVKDFKEQFKELETKYRDKEKEASILNHRVSELRRMVRFNVLRPLNNGDENAKDKTTAKLTGIVSPNSSKLPSSGQMIKTNLMKTQGDDIDYQEIKKQSSASRIQI